MESNIRFSWMGTDSVRMDDASEVLAESPVDGDKFDVKMNANYYVGVIMDDGGRSVRL